MTSVPTIKTDPPFDHNASLMHIRALKMIEDLDQTICAVIQQLTQCQSEDVDPAIKQLDDARGQIRTFMHTPLIGEQKIP